MAFQGANEIARSQLAAQRPNPLMRTANTKLLLGNGLYHGASTPVIDNGATHHTITNVNSVSWGVDQAPFAGGGSWRFRAASSQCLTIPDHANFDICALTEFNLSFWIRKNSITATSQVVASHFPNVNNWWTAYFDAGGYSKFVFRTVNTDRVVLTGATALTDLTEWHYIMIVKVGNNWGIYVDGQQDAYVSDADNGSLTGTLYIGQFGNATLYLDADLVDLCIQHDNLIGAAPNAGLTDLLPVPQGPITWGGV